VPKRLSAVDPTPETALARSQAARRERVVSAALSLAAEGGYDAVQMRDVAVRASVALGTIYRYFTSKDHLLAAACVGWVGDLERRLARRPARPTPSSSWWPSCGPPRRPSSASPAWPRRW
jgi:AcrR family transcriptional regulator